LTNGRAWTEEEVKILLDNPDMDTRALAEKIGRTRQSVGNKRSVLTCGYKANTENYDRRPSGWYEETIGKMLVECKDAFDSWKHYHRYVECVYMGEKLERIDVWVTMNCRRDADHP
jgi:hypothetical protein